MSRHVGTLSSPTLLQPAPCIDRAEPEFSEMRETSDDELNVPILQASSEVHDMISSSPKEHKNGHVWRATAEQS